ncbi:MAG: BTAD domain-containing putative transcriptional regulator [Gemmatimonadaceae bacterium]
MNRLKLFGCAAVDADSGPLTGRAAQRHRIALLSLLSTTRRASRSRDSLITLLWPDANAERGRRLLSDSIYRINRALGDDIVSGNTEEIRINRSLLSSDVADFEMAIESRDWQRAVELYAGPFLEGFFLPGSPEFERWLESERAHYAHSVARAVEALAVAARDECRVTEAVDWWQRLSLLGPDDSRVTMELMRAFERAGNRAAALRHAQLHMAHLHETLGFGPDRGVQELADAIAARREAPPCAHAALPATTTRRQSNNSYFIDGVSDELKNLLTHVLGLRLVKVLPQQFNQ